MRKPGVFLFVVVALVILGLSFAGCGRGGGGKTATPSAGGSATPSGGTGTFPTPIPGPGVGETIGVTDTSIKIGTLLPLSNTPATAWGIPLSQGYQAWFDYINDNGGSYGRKLELDLGDSQYVGPVASETVRTLVEQDGVFAMMGSLGIDVELAVMTYLQQKGVPDMLLQAAEQVLVNPISYQRYRWLPDYTQEGKVIGTYVGQNNAGKKVGILAQNDDFGKAGEAGVKQGLQAAKDNVQTTTQYYDPSETDMTSQVQRLKSDGAEVVVLYAQPAQAASAIKVGRDTLGWDVPFFLSGVDAAEIMGALAGYTEIEGTITVSFGPQDYQTEFPPVALFQENMKKYISSPQINSVSWSGYHDAALMTAILIQTGPDLTRTNFLKAAESICKWDDGALWMPVTFTPTDHDANTSEKFAKATGTGSDFKFEVFGNVVSFGTAPSCTPPTPPANATAQPGFSPQGQ
jgi:branched-chain amino acid transport system substrate-binding protein